jgi:nicotinamidase-related amidase
MEKPQRSALLVVDAQESFEVGARWERRSNPAFLENVKALVAAYRNAGMPIAFFLHTDGDPGFEETSPHFRLMEGLSPRGGEALFVKRTRNCFTSTPLLPWLLERGVGHVTVSGIQTEQCCETTTRVAADLGFRVDFVTEATLTFPIPHLDQPGRELGVAEIVERTEYALRGRFARIATVRDVVERLESGRWPAAA